jgi:hypothetical protein
MRKILFAAIAAAVASAAGLKQRLVRYDKEVVIFEDANPATKYSLIMNADFDFGYGLAADQEPASADANGDNVLTDNWIQTELWSGANIGFTLNILGYSISTVNIAFTPFQIVPLWLSLYHTHPYRFLVDGEDPVATFQAGYELHFGEVQLQYGMSNLLPHVSLYDAFFNSGDITPAKPTLNVADTTLSSYGNWDYFTELDSLKDDEYFHFNLLEWILTESGSTFEAYKAYTTIDLVGDSTTLGL